MSISSIAWAAIYGLTAGFVTFLILSALVLPTQPWSLIIGVLVFFACIFGNTPFRRI